MKVSSDDIVTKRIKEVLEQYEPDYSPQFWEKIRKQRPVPELWLTTLLQKYRFWLSVLTIAGISFIVYMGTGLLTADKNSAVDPLSSESLNYSVSERANEITNLEKNLASGESHSYNNISREEKNITFKVMPARITNPLPAGYQHNIPLENAMTGRPERIDKFPGKYVLLDGTDSGFHFRTPQLIPITYRADNIQLLKGLTYNKTEKFEFHWPDIHSLTTKKEDYDKFFGPNKLAFFYSPEIHFSDSLKTMGVSQGIGISFEGPVRSLVSVSVGLSYQANTFDKTILLGLVPPRDLVLQPGDTNRTFYYIDSIGIRRGSYKFLEVPVSLNFMFLETPRSQLWFGTGISSIAFLQQEYTYETYVEEVRESSSISVKAWKNIHPLASVNFSLLYRYNISDRYLLHGSIQYKHHLGTLGYNSMKLNRLNFQVGIIYRFGRED
jgi:hypothetical protein